MLMSIVSEMMLNDHLYINLTWEWKRGTARNGTSNDTSSGTRDSPTSAPRPNNHQIGDAPGSRSCPQALISIRPVPRNEVLAATAWTLHVAAAERRLSTRRTPRDTTRVRHRREPASGTCRLGAVAMGIIGGSALQQWPLSLTLLTDAREGDGGATSGEPHSRPSNTAVRR
jgi:hypothetical protein